MEPSGRPPNPEPPGVRQTFDVPEQMKTMLTSFYLFEDHRTPEPFEGRTRGGMQRIRHQSMQSVDACAHVARVQRDEHLQAAVKLSMAGKGPG